MSDPMELEVEQVGNMRGPYLARCRSSGAYRSEAGVLPVDYFHLVFTVPHPLNDWIEANQRVFYGLQFDRTADALKTLAAQSNHALGDGVQLGFQTVLHGWGQALLTHLHSHVVIPGGGFLLSSPRKQWVSCPEKEFFLDEARLADTYRDGYLRALRRLHGEGRLRPPRHSPPFPDLLRSLQTMRWVIHCGSPEHCHRPEAALQYLARYVVGASISDARILRDEEGLVTIRMKDYRESGRWKSIDMPGEEFVRRFLLHVMPPSMARARYYGFLGNRVRELSLAAARAQLGVRDTSTQVAVPARDQDPDRHDASGSEGSPPEADSPRACPYCGERQLRWVGQLPATYGWYQRVSLIPRAVKKRWQREREAARAQLHADSTLEAQKVPP